VKVLCVFNKVAIILLKSCEGRVLDRFCYDVVVYN